RLHGHLYCAGSGCRFDTGCRGRTADRARAADGDVDVAGTLTVDQERATGAGVRDVARTRIGERTEIAGRAWNDVQGAIALGGRDRAVVGERDGRAGKRRGELEPEPFDRHPRIDDADEAGIEVLQAIDNAGRGGVGDRLNGDRIG